MILNYLTRVLHASIDPPPVIKQIDIGFGGDGEIGGAVLKSHRCARARAHTDCWGTPPLHQTLHTLHAEVGHG